MAATDAQAETRLALVAALLRGHSTLTLSTCDEAGWPQATPLFYYVDDALALYWFSSARSAHSQHIARDPRVAVAVYRPTADWREICGVQARGEVREVEGPQRKAIAALYRERFNLGALFSVTMMRSALFRFQPSWIRYLDNAQGMGFKFEIDGAALAACAGQEVDIKQGAQKLWAGTLVSPDGTEGSTSC